MTYRELLELTQKHPNPFFNTEQHDRDFEFRYRTWMDQQDHLRNTEKSKTTAKKAKK